MPRTLFGFRSPLSRTTYRLFGLGSLFCLVLLWTLIDQLRLLPSEFFPGPAGVLNAAVLMFGKQEFHLHVLASVGRIAVAFVISAIFAVPIGLLMSSFRPVRAMLEPIIDFVRYVPVPSLLPIFVLWTGIGETAKLLVLFFGTFFQLVLLVMDDADHVPRINFDIARTLGARNRDLIPDVLIPCLMPQIWDRLRITLGWCWTYLVIAELIAVDWGIGHAIKEAQRFNAANQLFVSFIVLGLIGLATDFGMNQAHRWLFPYSIKSQSEVTVRS